MILIININRKRFFFLISIMTILYLFVSIFKLILQFLDIDDVAREFSYQENTSNKIMSLIILKYRLIIVIIFNCCYHFSDEKNSYFVPLIIFMMFTCWYLNDNLPVFLHQVALTIRDRQLEPVVDKLSFLTMSWAMKGPKVH